MNSFVEKEAHKQKLLQECKGQYEDAAEQYIFVQNVRSAFQRKLDLLQGMLCFVSPPTQ